MFAWGRVVITLLNNKVYRIYPTAQSVSGYFGVNVTYFRFQLMKKKRCVSVVVCVWGWEWVTVIMSLQRYTWAETKWQPAGKQMKGKRNDYLISDHTYSPGYHLKPLMFLFMSSSSCWFLNNDGVSVARKIWKYGNWL